MRQHGHIYGGEDPRAIPAYTTREAAFCLGIAYSRVRDWKRGHSGFARVLTANGEKQLSFFNLIEAWVLFDLRRRRFSLQELRRAIGYLGKSFPDVDFPLAQVDLYVSNEQLYAEHGKKLLNLTKEGQYGLTEVLRDFLMRVDKTPTEGIVRLYPFTTTRRDPQASRTVVIDPRVAFGRPVIAGTGMPTAVIAERFRAGEPISAIAEDTDLEAKEIEEALRYEQVGLGVAAA